MNASRISNGDGNTHSLAAEKPKAEDILITAALTEYGNAERFAWQHGTELRYCKPLARWFVWNGVQWMKRGDDDGEVMRRAKETIRLIELEAAATVEDDKRRHALISFAIKSESARSLTGMLHLAQSERPIPVLPERLDADPWLLNLTNGTLQLRSGKLRDHQRLDLITKLAPVAYDADARCPIWLGFLDRIMAGNQELVGFLQRVVGYALTGDVSAEVLFFLVGSGANGKSTFVCTLQEMLGDYARSMRSDILLSTGDVGAGRASPDLMVLSGARLVSCPETDEGRTLSAATVKQITSRDKIAARELYAPATEFAPSHKLFLATNHPPRVRTADDGTWRRILRVPFSVTIPVAEQDPRLLEKIRAELPGVLAWAVRGCTEWQRLGGGAVGLNAPAKVRQATSDYRKDEDRIAPFLGDRCVIAPGSLVAKGTLFAAYQKWADENRENPCSSRTFNARIGDLDWVADAKSGSTRLWRGIGIRDARDATDPVSINSPSAHARSEGLGNRAVSVPSVPSDAPTLMPENGRRG